MIWELLQQLACIFLGLQQAAAQVNKHVLSTPLFHSHSMTLTTWALLVVAFEVGVIDKW